MGTPAQFETLSISVLRPAPYNPRKPLDEFTFEQLKRSILDFGIVEPIVVNRRTGFTVIGGHQRLEVIWRCTHDTTVPCVVVDLDERDELRLNVALNAITGEWDFEKLKDVFELIDTGEDDSIEYVGFSAAEIERLMTSVPDPAEALDVGGGFDPAGESKTITAIVRCPVDAWPAVSEAVRAACAEHGATLDTA